MATVIWPEVITNEDFEYKNSEKELAYVDGLMSWALCMGGNKPPENFGKAMMKTGQLLKCTPTAEGLMKYSKTISR